MRLYLYQHPVTIVTTPPLTLAKQSLSSITEVPDLVEEFDDLKIDFSLRGDGGSQPLEGFHQDFDLETANLDAPQKSS